MHDPATQLPPVHVYGAQLVVPPSTHVPEPLQASELFCVVPLAQLCAWHTVPAAYFAHAPLPSQVPFWAQLATGSVAHSLSGSVAVVTAPHVPFVPPFFVALHAMHRPPHALLQQ